MNSSRDTHPDAKRSRLRGIIATIDNELSRLPKPAAIDGQSTATDRLLASWDELIAALALGPEPEVRRCPVCNHIGMRAATQCGHCWATLTPPTERDESAVG